MTYEEYPMVMVHPNAQPAVFVEEGASHQSRPATFPPVTVNDQDQREQYEAKGYQPAGKGDPHAYAKAALSTPPVNHVVEEYPKWCHGQIVNNEEEELARLEAMEPKADPAPLPVKQEPNLSRHKLGKIA